MSPGPSGTPQADIFRPMRLPAVLVGDHRLGGIASTISAAESLILRGYDIDAVVCFDDKSKYQNGGYLKGYFEKMGIPAFELPWVPSGIDECGEKEEREPARATKHMKLRRTSLTGTLCDSTRWRAWHHAQTT